MTLDVAADQERSARVNSPTEDISFSQYGEHWREMGKLAVIELFSLKKVQSYRNIREEEVEFMVKIVSQSASKFE